MRRNSRHLCVITHGFAAIPVALLGLISVAPAQQVQPNNQTQPYRNSAPPQQNGGAGQNGQFGAVQQPQQQVPQQQTQFQAQQPTQQQPVRPAQNQQTQQISVQPQQTPPTPRVPYVLSAQEQAEVNHVLAEWEKKGKSVKDFACEFERFDYEPPTEDPITHQLKLAGPVNAKGQPIPVAKRVGLLKYGEPDKGIFHVTEVSVYDSNTGKYETPKIDEREKWVCDGKSIYEFRGPQKQLIETKLAPEMQGKAIADGPLPFLFGSEAATLSRRYWLRLVTPADAKGQAWIEALPKYQADAANFRRATLILDSKTLQPLFLDLVDPTQARKMYAFSKIKENSFFSNGFTIFGQGPFNPSTPFNWTRIVEDPSKQSPTANYIPSATGGNNNVTPASATNSQPATGGNGAASRPMVSPR